jgi:nitrate/nitrite transport system substrate-binding protein
VSCTSSVVFPRETRPTNRTRTVINMNRRKFLKLGGTAVLAPAVLSLLNACGSSSTAAPAATTGGGATTGPATTVDTATTAAPVTTAGAATTVAGATTAAPAKKEVRKVTLGFIALTDAASLIMAKELGFFEKRSLDVTVAKQASWPALRDALLNNQIDGAHCLYSMPFSVATKIGGPGSTDLKIAMILSNNGQAITLAKEFASVGYGDLTKAKDLFAKANAPELAMTFPGGTHDLWLRYWLKACGVDASTLKIGPVPPPQMVQNMTVGNVKGYCVGEPWNAVAVTQGIGFTTLATQDLWLNHPEKALVVGNKFATERTDALEDVMAAVLEASKWLDDPANRAKAADTLGQEKYVNAKPDDIRGRLTGVYKLGADLPDKDFKGEQMQFFRGGETNFPRRSYGIWALAQYQRLGMLKETPDYKKLVDSIILTDLYTKVAKAEGLTIPDDDMKPFEVRLDKAMFDPAKPEDEVKRA